MAFIAEGNHNFLLKTKTPDSENQVWTSLVSFGSKHSHVLVNLTWTAFAALISLAPDNVSASETDKDSADTVKHSTWVFFLEDSRN